MSRQPGERRQANERTDSQSQLLYQTGYGPIGLGGIAHQEHLSFRLLPAHERALGCAEGGHGSRTPHDFGCIQHPFVR